MLRNSERFMNLATPWRWCELENCHKGLKIIFLLLYQNLLALTLKRRKESNSKKQRGYWRMNTLNLCEALPLSHLVRCCGCSWEERNSTHCPQDSCLCSEEENPKTHPRRWGWGAVNSDKSSIIAPWWSTFEAQNPSEENCGNIPFLFWLKKVSYRKRRK